ncbi:CAP domain-containing protein, partial [Frankia sp. EI5c]
GSAGHRANILNCGYTRIGVGYAEGGSYRYYWTQVFGTR